MNSLAFCDSGYLSNFISFAVFLCKLSNETTPEIWVVPVYFCISKYYIHTILYFIVCVCIFDGREPSSFTHIVAHFHWHRQTRNDDKRKIKNKVNFLFKWQFSCQKTFEKINIQHLLHANFLFFYSHDIGETSVSQKKTLMKISKNRIFDVRKIIIRVNIENFFFAYVLSWKTNNCQMKPQTLNTRPIPCYCRDCRYMLTVRIQFSV